MMSSPAHILSVISINPGGVAGGMLFARVGLTHGPDSQPEPSGSPAGSGAALARRWTALCHHQFRKMPLLSPPGHSWDRTGWIEPCIALTSTTVPTGWVSPEPPDAHTGGNSSVPHIPRVRVLICPLSEVRFLMGIPVLVSACAELLIEPFTAGGFKSGQNPN